MLHFFFVFHSLWIALFDVALLHATMFSFRILLHMHSSHVTIFFCRTLLILHYFQKCSQDPHKHLRWRGLQQQFFTLDVHGVLATLLLFPCCIFSCCTFFELHSSHFALSPCCTFSMLQFFHVALFLCRTFFMLHFFHDALYSCCTLSMLHLCCTIFSFLFALFSCCTCSSLKKIEYERKTENTTEKQH